MNIFICLMVAHILGDIIFASHRIANLKRSPALSSKIIGHTTHGLIHGFLAGGLLIVFIRDQVWLEAGVYVLLIHIIIDFIRTSIETKIYGAGKVYVKLSEFIDWVSGKSKDPEKMNFKNLILWFLIFDQVCHVISLFIISMVLS